MGRLAMLSLSLLLAGQAAAVLLPAEVQACEKHARGHQNQSGSDTDKEFSSKR